MTIKFFIASILIVLSLVAKAETAASVAAATQLKIDQGQPPAWWLPDLPDAVQNQVDSKGAGLAAKLELSDEVTAKVAAIVSAHYAKVWAWHQKVDQKLDAAWADWDEARNNVDGKEKDELKALTIMTERIDPIYAEFKPQIQNVLANLQEAIGEEKTMTLLDHITWSPGAKRTYTAYTEMVPQMTDAEKAVLWQRMAQAREDCLACWTSKRIIKIFKKYKVRNEFSLDYFGYGYREHYQAWIKRKNS